MIKREDVYKIGRIGKPHGVKGEVTMMFSDDVFDRAEAEYLILDIDGILVPFFFDEYRFKTEETALMLFSGITTKEQAQELTGCDVYFPRSLAEAGDGPVSRAGIVGFTLVDEEGQAIGKITSVDTSTVNILFNISTPQGHEALIPAAEEFILNVDAAQQTITVRLPEGLLGLD